MSNFHMKPQSIGYPAIPRPQDDDEEDEITGGGVLPQEDEDDETTGGGVLPQEDEDEEVRRGKFDMGFSTTVNIR